MLRSVCCDIMMLQGRWTFLAFLDDTVWREGLWMKMREYRVQEEFVNICKSLYEASVLLG